MYEVGTSVDVRAFHVMPGMPPPEGERHSHDYRIDVTVQRGDLDERGMVVDLDLLDDALRSLAERLTDRDLEEFVTDAEAVTVEAFARWTHAQVAHALGALPQATLAVRVWETSTAFGGFTSGLDPAGPRRAGS